MLIVFAIGETIIIFFSLQVKKRTEENKGKKVWKRSKSGW